MHEVEKKLVKRSEAPSGAKFGAVTFLQNFGSTLNVHPHYHSVVIEGVFVPDGEGVKFYEAQIEQSDIQDVQEKFRKRVLKLFRWHGILTQDEVDDMLSNKKGGGFSLDGSVRIEANDRAGLERLIRYCARPPFSGKRLRIADDGKFLYVPQKPGPRGQGLLEMTGPELLEKLSWLIPRPRKHRHHYHGVLGPSSGLRAAVVALAAKEPKITRTECPEAPEDDVPKSRAAYRWAVLIARLFEVWPLTCPRCQGTMKIVAFIEEPDVIHKILSHIGAPTEPPMCAPARGPPEWDEVEEAFPDDNIIDEYPEEPAEEHWD